MTTLEIVLSVACVVLLVLFVMSAIAGSQLKDAYDTMRHACDHWEGQATAMHEIVKHYERKNRERKEHQ